MFKRMFVWILSEFLNSAPTICSNMISSCCSKAFLDCRMELQQRIADRRCGIELRETEPSWHSWPHAGYYWSRGDGVNPVAVRRGDRHSFQRLRWYLWCPMVDSILTGYSLMSGQPCTRHPTPLRPARGSRGTATRTWTRIAPHSCFAALAKKTTEACSRDIDFTDP